VDASWLSIDGVVKNVIACTSNRKYRVVWSELEMTHVFLRILPSERVDESAEFGMYSRLEIRETPRLRMSTSCENQDYVHVMEKIYHIHVSVDSGTN
jgi:hypothetical protein